LDNINLFQVITIMAFFILLPVSITLEGLPALPANLAAAVSSQPHRAPIISLRRTPCQPAGTCS
jgi:hypothetical protein